MAAPFGGHPTHVVGGLVGSSAMGCRGQETTISTIRVESPIKHRGAMDGHNAPVCAGGRGVLVERKHSPFQVLDASAIEGIRGLAGESSSIYSCIQISKALTPPAPPSVSRRDGRTWASILRGIL